MNPRGFMRIQGLLAAALGVAAGFTDAAWVAAGLGLLVGGLWLMLRRGYLRVLNGGARRRDDAVVEAVALAVVLLPLAAAAGIPAFAYDDRPVDAASVAVILGALAALFDVLFASSLVDWYLVRPAVDGHVRLPPCRSSGDEAWLGVSRAVFAHRALAEIGAVLAIVVAATAAIVAVVQPGTEATAAIAGLAALGFGTLLQGAVRTLQLYVINAPWLAVGDVLQEPGGREHYVAQIATTGLYVRTRADDGWNGRLRPIALKRLEEESFEQLEGNQCGPECRRLNGTCAWAGGRPSWLAPERDEAPDAAAASDGR